jgi:hypothetical protein
MNIAAAMPKKKVRKMLVKLAIRLGRIGFV